MTSVQIYSARTWGAMGNLLAGRHLGSVLDRNPVWQVDVQAIEDLVSWMAEAGRQIKDITTATTNHDQLRESYLRFAESASQLVPTGFELDTETPPIDLGPLADRLLTTRPDIVIGTKGIVSRMLTWCVRAHQLPTRVLNYVTNPGLLEMDMHLTPHADLVTVPFPWNRDRLRERSDLPASRIIVPGPLLAAGSMPSNARPSEEHQRPIVLILNNRGGPAFSELVLELAAHAGDIHVAYVVVDQPDEITRTQEACRARGWDVFDRLPQDRYLEFLDWARRAPGSFLVSKAGPNTVLEAANQTIPLVVMPSGLPMEDWVPDLVVQHSLGVRTDGASDLIDVARVWLDPVTTARIREGAARFRAEHLDQDHADSIVTAAIDSLRRNP